MSVVSSSAAAVNGRTAISAAALRAAARAVAAAELRVEPSAVTCRLRDDRGRLVVELDLPAHLPLAGLVSRVDAARVAVRDRFAQLSGSELAAVRIRITGWRPASERRVV